MADHPRYTDAQIDAAIAELRAGGEPLAGEILEYLSNEQLARYRHAVEKEQFAVQCQIRRSWFTDPALRGLEAPFPMFDWDPPTPDDPSGLTGDGVR
jgi:hypothetical protein